jgi:type II secretory pathway component PulJ
MNQDSPASYLIEFADLELRFGSDNALAILRTLEQFEGVHEALVARLSRAERLQNVFAVMKDNMRYQTRH